MSLAIPLAAYTSILQGRWKLTEDPHLGRWLSAVHLLNLGLQVEVLPPGRPDHSRESSSPNNLDKVLAQNDRLHEQSAFIQGFKAHWTSSPLSQGQMVVLEDLTCFISRPLPGNVGDILILKNHSFII